MRYGVQGSAVGDRTVQMVSGGDTTQTTISELSPSTTYSIEVAAVNSVGAGVYSDPPVIVEIPRSKWYMYMYLM